MNRWQLHRLLSTVSLAGLIAVALVACGSPTTPPPATAPAPTAFAPRTYSFDQTGEWDVFNVPIEDTPSEVQGSSSIKDGQLLLSVDVANGYVWSNPLPPTLASDVQIEVEAKKTSGSNDNLFGVICRYKDGLNFYFFVISSDGHFGIGKVKEGKFFLLNRWDYPPTDAIHMGEHTNRLSVTCEGDSLSLSVNGTWVDTQRDTDFTSGNIGLIAAALESTTTIAFDNLSVRGP